jgi:hypothetical protein
MKLMSEGGGDIGNRTTFTVDVMVNVSDNMGGRRSGRRARRERWGCWEGRNEGIVVGIRIQIMPLQRYALLEKGPSRVLAEGEYQGTCKVATLQMFRNTAGLDRCVDLILEFWTSMEFL